MSVDDLAVDILLDAGAEVGEGAIWDATQGRLLWVDIPVGLIHSLDPVSGSADTWQAGQPVGAVALRTRGGLVMALRDGFGLLDGDAVTMLAWVEVEQHQNRMNDGNVDSAGRFWAGTMGLDMRPGAGALYRLDADHAVHRMVSPMSVPNGIDWSADGRSMYLVDSGLGRVDAFAFDAESGAIAGRRPICEVPSSAGLPDGLTVDADGFLWVAVWGEGAVRRYAPDGRLAGRVHVPASQVTSCTFGGPELDTLFITTAAHGVREKEAHAGAVFACRPGTSGRLPQRYAG